MIIDATLKPHHASPLEENLEIERRVDDLAARGGALAGVFK
jgi:4-hydroxy-3-polyprenylbenzoate decarboxylase